jgi:hypothetical protein
MIFSLTPTHNPNQGHAITKIEQVMKLKTERYNFPDPNLCYILSDLTGLYKGLYKSNTTLVSQMGEEKQIPFWISYNQTSVVALSNNLFTGTQPMVGIEMLALKNAIRKNAKSLPTLPNRL